MVISNLPLNNNDSASTLLSQTSNVNLAPVSICNSSHCNYLLVGSDEAINNVISRQLSLTRRLTPNFCSSQSLSEAGTRRSEPRQGGRRGAYSDVEPQSPGTTAELPSLPKKQRCKQIGSDSPASQDAMGRTAWVQRSHLEFTAPIQQPSFFSPYPTRPRWC